MPEYEVLPNKQKGWGPGTAPAVVHVANNCPGNPLQKLGRYEVKVAALPERRNLPWGQTDNWPTHNASFSVKNIGTVPLTISW